MTNPLVALLQAWRRRWWRADAAALAKYAGLKPMTVVTGGSEGIGYELACRFARNGHDVMLVARRSGPLALAAAEIRRQHNVEAVPLAADVTAPNAIGLIEAALSAQGAYADVLVNSAGVGLSGAFDAQPAHNIAHLVDLNVGALTRLTRHFLTGMLERGRGGILNVSSLGGYAPGPNQAAYYASKAYVLSLTEAIAAEVAGKGVRVCVLAPGPVETAFHARMGADTALYRKVLPQASAASVARAGHMGFVLGLRVVIPGLINPLLALAMRILPHRIVVPIIGWLLKPRAQGPGNA